MVILVNPEQLSKQDFPKLVTEFGIVMLVNPEQYWKHQSPKLVTLYSVSFTFIDDGIVISPSYVLSPFVTSATLPFGIKL